MLFSWGNRTFKSSRVFACLLAAYSWNVCPFSYKLDVVVITLIPPTSRYHCYPPFESRACSTKEDCNYYLSQLRWGIETALDMTVRFGLQAELVKAGVDIVWWESLLGNASAGPGGDAKLAWYPYDNVTG